MDYILKKKVHWVSPSCCYLVTTRWHYSLMRGVKAETYVVFGLTNSQRYFLETRLHVLGGQTNGRVCGLYFPHYICTYAQHFGTILFFNIQQNYL